MPKRIVFCADGTWQGPLNNTNIYCIYKALTVSATQVPLYDDGVGADAAGLDHLLQGAFGIGLTQKVLDGYTRIAHLYSPGDEIFLFGFSRGAYTARSLAGMIAACGLPSGTFTDSCVTDAFAAYRDPANRAARLASLAPCALADATIRMVGVFDTVGSLGIPAIFGQVDQRLYGFLDTGLHPDVKSAYQALAIDEQRPQFPATLWTSPPAPGQTIEQLWFSGCHCDIGGGTLPGGPLDAGTRLCDLTLGWMLGNAVSQGLDFDPAVLAQYRTLPAKFALDAIRQSWKPADGPPHHRPIAPASKVANSVAVRIQYALDYTPPNLTLDDDGALADTYAAIPIVDETAL